MMAIKYDLDTVQEEEEAKGAGRERGAAGGGAATALKEAQQKFSNKIRHTKRSSRWQHRSLAKEEGRVEGDR